MYVPFAGKLFLYCHLLELTDWYHLELVHCEWKSTQEKTVKAVQDTANLFIQPIVEAATSFITISLKSQHFTIADFSYHVLIVLQHPNRVTVQNPPCSVKVTVKSSFANKVIITKSNHTYKITTLMNTFGSIISTRHAKWVTVSAGESSHTQAWLKVLLFPNFITKNIQSKSFMHKWNMLWQGTCICT